MSTIVNDPNTRENGHARTNNSRLKFLDDLSGYKVHHDDVDPRGYTVKLPSGESIGEVEGLLADTQAKLVRYVEVEIDDDIINRHERGLYTDQDRHALIPVGLIHIDKSSRSVTVSGVGYDHFTDYPRSQRDKGYSTGYEIDTNDYLSGFHDYGSSYNRDRYSSDTHRNADRLDDDFYTSDFYATRSSRNTM
ncbi:hypothetical protein GGR26_000890 [Lewinella marina]|uniref:PRC-barrel domain-containing protein n=1 Tax=Neolewinella marina TaxID=438751 RepID=A0A2G0CIH9_9BACT|nr:hypothetical protein [Neolewinella marina]NJB85145.1 hypothetical protein [Neolewinella marina]PHK99720.1 hypothetical protein CGL56_01330 [Neolewinella marina]